MKTVENVTEKKYVLMGTETKFSPLGAFSFDETVRFCLHVPLSSDVVKTVLRIHSDADGKMHLYDMEKTDEAFRADVALFELCGDAEDGLFYYCYDVYYREKCITYGGESPEILYTCDEDGKRQLLVYKKGTHTPQWLKGGIIYHIFVDRFCSSGRAVPKRGTVINPDWDHGIPQYAINPGDDLPNNVFFGGDLFGVAEKMEYIASLGVNCLYLSPIFDAASNHKYDTGDYGKIDEMFGGEEGFNALISAAKSHGIHVILDGVFNHTGSDSVYFNRFLNYDSIGACQSKESPYYPWYIFYEHPDVYESWWGMPTLPKVRGDEVSYREYILGEDGIVAKWTKLGVDGWRLDVADELTEGFLDALHDRLKKTKPEAVIYGEVWEDATNKRSYGIRRRYLRGGQLHSVMNYPLREAVVSYIRYGDAEKFTNIVEPLYRRYPKDAADLLMNLLGTHDTMRILTALAGDYPDGFSNTELAKKRLTPEQYARGIRLLKMAYALVSVMPGVPSIFYGDEVGIEGYGDPFCRMPFPWGREDENLLTYYRKVGVLHRSEPVFSDGFVRVLKATPEYLIIVRENGCDPAVMLILNRSDAEICVCLTHEVSGIDVEYAGNSPVVPPLAAYHYHSPDGIMLRSNKKDAS